jgi:hypothetical protein
MKIFSRALLVLACAGLIASPALAQWGSTITGLNMTSTSATGAQASVNLSGATAVMFHVTSGTTSTSSIFFQQSIDGTHWYTSATITDAAAAGELWACPASPWARFNVSTHSAGTLQGYMVARTMASDPIGTSCKKLDFNEAASLGVMTVTSLDTSGTISTSGAVTAATVTASGTITGATLASTGGITAATTVAATGGVSGTTGTFSSTVSGVAGTFSGAVSGTTITGSGAIAGTTLKGTSYTTTRIPYFSTSGILVDLANFTYTTATGALLNTAGTAPSISTNRFLSTGTAPTVANVGANSCGTDAATIAGKDQASVITVGATSGTECRISFNVAFANAPVCTATATIATDLHLVTTTANVTVTGTLTAAEKIYVLCFGY